MVKHPSVRHDTRIKLAHQALSNVVDTVFVMPLIHDGHTLLLLLHLGKIGHVVVLPDEIEAVYLMTADGSCNVSATQFIWKLGRPLRLPDLQDVFFVHPNQPDYQNIVLARIPRGKNSGYGASHSMISCHAFTTASFWGPVHRVWCHKEPLNWRSTYGNGTTPSLTGASKVSGSFEGPCLG